MQLRNLIWIIPTASTIVSGAPMDDIESLRNACEISADSLNASLNNTRALVGYKPKLAKVHD